MATSDIITLITAIVGIAVSYFFFLRSQRLRKPCWAIRSNNLIENYGSTFSKLEVFYAQNKVENLTVSKFLFWNAGSETIERQHIVTANPLRILGAEGVKLLDVEILAQNNRFSDFAASLSEDNLSVFLAFEYLDRGHGAVLQVTHTGLSSDDIQVEGSIKGVGSVKKKRVKSILLPLPTPVSFDKKIRAPIRRRLSIAVFLMGSVSMTIFAYAIVAPRYLTRPAWETVLMGVYVFLFLLYSLIQSIDLLSNAPPQGLEIFEE
jgi:hypothetical protein